MTDTTDATSILPEHVDPICGMAIDPATAVASTEYEGVTYYFCSEDCHRTFAADPSVYVGS